MKILIRIISYGIVTLVLQKGENKPLLHLMAITIVISFIICFINDVKYIINKYKQRKYGKDEL